jgi:crossover junction endodeoxyribonuclease RuvC
MKILGIDPGTGICGFGVIEVSANIKPDKSSLAPVNTLYRGRPKMLDCGVISTPPHTPLSDRLLDIYESMHEIIKTNKPDIMAIEKLFFVQNITTGISVAEARGVVLLVAKQENLPVFEYNPNQIKKALTGYGHAEKKQIQEMVKQHLNLKKAPEPDDAADALAVAITHSLISHLEQ